MRLSISQIAEMLDAEVEGDYSIEIKDIAKIEEAIPGCITFLANPKYKSYVATTQASAIIVSKDFEANTNRSITFLRVENPYISFSKILHYIDRIKNPPKKGIDEKSEISPNAQIGKDVYIGAFSYISANAQIGNDVQIYPHVYIGENVVLGDNCIVYPQVAIYKDCIVGKNCIIHSGVCIGSDGFGFAPQDEGIYMKIPQIGNVVIGNDVEIGANTTIDRATTGSTKIANGVKIDNLVQVAHNVTVGEHTVLAAQVGISGSSKVGKHNLIGGQVGIVGHIETANYVKIAAKSGVHRSLDKPHTSWKGIPVQPYYDQLRTEVLIKKLELMEKRIQELEKKIEVNK